MRTLTRFAVLGALLLFVAVSAFAQTTAQLTGNVTSDGNPLPGVSVTISSPSLQGTRTAVTGEAGAYNFPALPPGEYTVVFELSGMDKVTKKVRVQLSQTARADATLRLAGVAEAITVTASAPSVLETPSVSSNMTLKEVERLPIPRNQLATALLAPGVNDNTLSANQLQISGSPGYDNLVLVNGVVVTENVRSQMRPLYIEDAIQETTVMTGGISAEYGRFTGGVVNTITKSGGNQFSGSLRDSLSNPSWVAATPLTTSRLDKINNVYEGTLGGFVLRDRLWFFGAGRMAKTDTSTNTIAIPSSPNWQTIPYTVGSDEKRYEAKLTGQITAKHNLVGSYFKIDSKGTNTRFTTSIYDLESLNDREDPEELKSATYNGVITSNLLIEGQWSQRDQAFVGSGSKYTDLIKGTLLLDLGNSSARFNSPTFCGVCDTETRNNNEYIVKANYFLNTRSMGSHNFVAGIDRFEEQRYANNFQSGSNFRIFVTGARGANGVIYPIITPTTATGGGSYIRWTPIFVDADESNLRTDSLFLNDKWDLNQHWSFNLGVRFDKNNSVDAMGNTSSDDQAFSPRLGVQYDLRGDGRHRFSAAYANYASRIVEGVASGNNAAGNPATIDFAYKGPAINNGTLDTPLPDAIARVFEYFNSVQGGTGNVSAENLRASGARSIPGYAVYFDGTLQSPTTREITFGYGAQIGQTGYAKIDLISRDWSDFYAQSVTTNTTRTTTPLGIPVDLRLYKNSDNIERTYRGVQLQGRWNPGRIQTGFNYTWAKLRGNDEGETAASGPVTNIDTSVYYPEFLNYDRYLPTGYLAGDQRHRARAWVGYDIPLPDVVGRVNVSLLQNFDSGLAYSAVGTITATGYAGAPVRQTYGYNSVPSGQYYFSDRGEYRTDDTMATNFALRYSRGLFRGIEFFAQADLLNIFNHDDAFAVNQTVRTSQSGLTAGGTNAFRTFNPFTDTPVECPQGAALATCQAMGANWQKGPQFGTPTTTGSYQTPRTHRFSVGFRF
jgi:outer membrane receptor protein involved in Fe transport